MEAGTERLRDCCTLWERLTRSRLTLSVTYGDSSPQRGRSEE